MPDEYFISIGNPQFVRSRSDLNSCSQIIFTKIKIKINGIIASGL